MGVQLVLATAVLLEVAEESAVAFPEGRSLKVAAEHGGVDAGVVREVSHRDGQVARAEFDVLVPGDALHGQVPCRHANVKRGSGRDFDGDLKAVAWPTGDAQVGVMVGTFEADGQIL